MAALETLVRQYSCALREEPKLRAFAVASFVDDIGLAVATWATMLLLTNLFTTQRERASLMLPSLFCFLLGTIVSGPLADWAARFSFARLARWRWRLVLWARLAETAMLGVLMIQLRAGSPSIAQVLPFAMLTAFTKTAFRPTRIAFAVDLLERESAQVDDAGKPLLDERGEPLRYKTHLLPMDSLIGTLSAAASLAGLLLGGRILDLSAGRYAPLFLVQALAQIGFVAVVFLFCHPSKPARDVRVRELFGETPSDAESEGPAPRFSIRESASHFTSSLRDVLRFLRKPEQRPLLVLLVGALVVELVSESYNGKMIIKHVLHGSDESVRQAEIVWSVVGLLGVAAVPALARALGSIGRVFLFTMLLDGIVISFAGRSAAAEAPHAIMPFVGILVADHTLTLVSGSLTGFAQNSASSAAMRGRIAGAYAFFVIIGDMVAEGLATEVSESIGIPAMLVRVGVIQVVVVLLLALVGGRRLWRFGLHDADQPAPALPAVEVAS